MAVYFRLAAREDIQPFRDFVDGRSLCYNLSRKLEQFLEVHLSRDKQRDQFEVVRLNGEEPPQGPCMDTPTRYTGDVLVRWKVQSIAGKVKLRFKNLEQFPDTTCYLQGASQVSGLKGRYWVFYQPDDLASFDVGHKFTSKYTKYGRRYVRSDQPLTLLRIPYGALTSDEPEELAPEYGDDIKLLLQAVELVNATALERKQFRWAILQTYFFDSTTSDILALDFLAQEGLAEEDFAAFVGNPDLVMDDFLCRLLPKLHTDLIVHGWVRYADMKLKNRAEGTEVMLCHPAVNLQETDECKVR